MAQGRKKQNRTAVDQPLSSNQSSTIEAVEPLIREARGQKIILDSDLARVYGVPTKRLNEQVKRNLLRFPSDFVFQLTEGEANEMLRSRSQTATLKRGQNIKYRPYAFTEHGAIMAANILSSARAVEMSVYVVRAFVKMRSVLAEHKDLARELAEVESKLTERLDAHELAIIDVLRRIMLLLDPPPPPPGPPVRKIGFRAK